MASSPPSAEPSSDAVRLYIEILQPIRAARVLDALEQHAERARTGRTWGALELRSELASDPAQKLAVMQKLGSGYDDHLGDQSSARARAGVLVMQPGTRARCACWRCDLQRGDYDGLTELYGHAPRLGRLAECSRAAIAPGSGAKVERSSGRRECSSIVGETSAPSVPTACSRRTQRAWGRRALIPISKKTKVDALAGAYEVLAESADSEAESSSS